MTVERIGAAVLHLADWREVLIETADTIISDPPYGMEFVSNYRKVKHDRIVNDDREECLIALANREVNHSKYIFCRWDNLLNNRLPKPKSVITWVKNNWSMGDLNGEHARQTELVLFYPGEAHRFPNGRPQDVIRASRSGNANHPSEKPIGLMGVIVSWTEGTVLDPFMGSGSTGVACAKAGRRFIGAEIEQKYFDIACRRIEQAYAQMDLFANG